MNQQQHASLFKQYEGR